MHCSSKLICSLHLPLILNVFVYCDMGVYTEDEFYLFNYYFFLLLLLHLQIDFDKLHCFNIKKTRDGGFVSFLSVYSFAVITVVRNEQPHRFNRFTVQHNNVQTHTATEQSQRLQNNKSHPTLK